MTRWFRFYDAVLDDPKVQRLPDAMFRAWVNLMCLASRHGGKILKNWDDISFALRVEISVAKSLICDLVKAGLIDERAKHYEPHNWEKRQYKSDTSTERVKRFRKQRETVAETAPEQKQSRAEQKSKKPRSASLPRFDEFWLVCPKKSARGAAEKAWPKALCLTDADTLIRAMRSYAASCVGKDQAYIKTPGPWLNDKRWLDEGIAPSGEPVDEAAIEAARDKADQYFKRGKYAEKIA